MTSPSDNLDLIRRLDGISVRFHKVKTLKELAIAVEEILEEFIDVEYSGLYFYEREEERLKLFVA